MHRRAFMGAAALSAVGAGLGTPARGAGSTDPVAFTVEIRVRPGRETEFLDLLHPVLDAMRHEPTFLNATLHRDPEDPSRFLIYECWTDLDDVRDVQLARPYRQAYLQRLPDLLEGERSVAIWRPLRSDGADCLPR